jgi:hypothetical protein
MISMFEVALKENSRWRPFYRDQQNFWKGVQTKTTPTGVKVSYVSRGSNPESELRHDYYGVFNVAKSQQGQDIVLNIECPSTMKTEMSNLNIFGEWDPYISKDKAIEDLRFLCSSTPLKFSRLETGDFNVNFPDASVYANFARKLQAYTYTPTGASQIKKDDIAKFRWFTVPDGKSLKTLGITVFPYRNGSKVTYRWENEAICKPNAGCNYDSGAAKRMLDIVTSIAND